MDLPNLSLFTSSIYLVYACFIRGYPLHIPGILSKVLVLTMEIIQRRWLYSSLVKIGTNTIFNPILYQTSCKTDFLKIDGNQFCGYQQARLAYQFAKNGPVQIEYRSDHPGEPKTARFDLKGFKVYFELFDLKSAFTTSTQTPTTAFVYRESKRRVTGDA